MTNQATFAEYQSNGQDVSGHLDTTLTAQNWPCQIS